MINNSRAGLFKKFVQMEFYAWCIKLTFKAVQTMANSDLIFYEIF